MAKASKELEYLATVPLFSALTRPELQQVVQAAEQLDVEAGEELVTEGRVGREFFLILVGEAVVRRGDDEVATLEPGQWFGELALIDNEPRSATVQAVTDMKLLVLGQAEFAGLLETVPGIAAKLLTGMAHRLREADTARGPELRRGCRSGRVRGRRRVGGFEAHGGEAGLALHEPAVGAVVRGGAGDDAVVARLGEPRRPPCADAALERGPQLVHRRLRARPGRSGARRRSAWRRR